ncbi:MAG: hypothetical protein QXZ20_01145, partial [Candidatus Aenigmatarchaeota archaeon]
MKNFKLIFLILFFTTIYFLNLKGYLTAGGDDTYYFLLAKSLKETKTYSDIYLPKIEPHKVYPPIFPFLLSILMQFGIKNIFLLKLLPLFSSLISLFFLYFLLKHHQIKEPYKIIALFALSPLLVYKSTNLLSEPLYILFSFLALLFLDLSNKKNSYLYLAIFFIVLAFYTRTVGLALVLTFFIFYKDKPKKFLLAGSFIIISISFWFFRLYKVGSVYFDFLLKKEVSNLADLFFRFFKNFFIYISKIIADLFFYPVFEDITKKNPLIFLKIFLSLFFTFFILKGFIMSFKKRKASFNIYVIFFLIICFFWPLYGARFILPIFCFLILFLFEGLEYFK